MRALAAIFAIFAVSFIAPTAHAFRTAAAFNTAARDGGGGSRHFTGSIGDGYTCAVCHRGGEVDPVEIQGVPYDGYVPGGTYEIEILLPPTPDATSLSMELTDMRGAKVGSLLVPADLGEQDRCDDGTDATGSVTLPNDRTVIAMDACGAERVRAMWTAPLEPPGAIWFHAVVVTADGSGDPEGDGVQAIAQVIPVAGTSAEATRIGSTACSATGSSPAPAAPIALALGVLALRRRRR